MKPPLPNAPPAVHLGYLASRVRELGGTVERDDFSVRLIAPEGKVWVVDSERILQMQWAPLDRPEWKVTRIQDALERIGHGFTECTN